MTLLEPGCQLRRLDEHRVDHDAVGVGDRQLAFEPERPVYFRAHLPAQIGRGGPHLVERAFP